MVNVPPRGWAARLDQKMKGCVSEAALAVAVVVLCVYNDGTDYFEITVLLGQTQSAGFEVLSYREIYHIFL